MIASYSREKNLLCLIPEDHEEEAWFPELSDLKVVLSYIPDEDTMEYVDRWATETVNFLPAQPAE